MTEPTIQPMDMVSEEPGAVAGSTVVAEVPAPAHTIDLQLTDVDISTLIEIKEAQIERAQIELTAHETAHEALVSLRGQLTPAMVVSATLRL